MDAAQFVSALTSSRTLDCLQFFSDHEKKNCCHALFLCGHTFSLLRNKYIGVGVWGCMVSICLALQETGKLFSKVAARLCLPISNV